MADSQQDSGSSSQGGQYIKLMLFYRPVPVIVGITFRSLQKIRLPTSHLPPSASAPVYSHAPIFLFGETFRLLSLSSYFSASNIKFYTIFTGICHGFSSMAYQPVCVCPCSIDNKFSGFLIVLVLC